MNNTNINIHICSIKGLFVCLSVRSPSDRVRVRVRRPATRSVRSVLSLCRAERDAALEPADRQRARARLRPAEPEGPAGPEPVGRGGGEQPVGRCAERRGLPALRCAGSRRVRSSSRSVVQNVRRPVGRSASRVHRLRTERQRRQQQQLEQHLQSAGQLRLSFRPGLHSPNTLEMHQTCTSPLSSSSFLFHTLILNSFLLIEGLRIPFNLLLIYIFVYLSKFFSSIRPLDSF